ncbi:MAG TPA: hypothetical protein PLA25_12380 [Anaerolineaceae bacterium]|nr:hypothetical protein [Anaerolineaceae bacterium]
MDILIEWGPIGALVLVVSLFLVEMRRLQASHREENAEWLKQIQRQNVDFRATLSEQARCNAEAVKAAAEANKEATDALATRLVDAITEALANAVTNIVSQFTSQLADHDANVARRITDVVEQVTFENGSTTTTTIVKKKRGAPKQA